MVTAACGNVTQDVTYEGLTGIEIDAKGSLSIRAVTCGEPVDVIDVSQDREGLADDQSNQVVANLKATAPRDTDVTVNLSAPGSGWEPSGAVRLDPDTGYIFSAGTAEGPTEQVWVSAAKRSTLRPGTVYVADYSSGDDALAALTETEFAQRAAQGCDQ